MKHGDNVHKTVGGSGCDYITILGAGCADGTQLPPFVVIRAYSERNELRLYSGFIEFCDASLWASKTLFLLTTVSQAPSPAHKDVKQGELPS